MSLSKVARPLQTPKGQLSLIPVSKKVLAFYLPPSFSSFGHILTTLSEENHLKKAFDRLWSETLVWDFCMIFV